MVTLEDVLEEILGREIEDERDACRINTRSDTSAAVNKTGTGIGIGIGTGTGIENESRGRARAKAGAESGNKSTIASLKANVYCSVFIIFCCCYVSIAVSSSSARSSPFALSLFCFVFC